MGRMRLGFMAGQNKATGVGVKRRSPPHDISGASPSCRPLPLRRSPDRQVARHSCLATGGWKASQPADRNVGATSNVPSAPTTRRCTVTSGAALPAWSGTARCVGRARGPDKNPRCRDRSQFSRGLSRFAAQPNRVFDSTLSTRQPADSFWSIEPVR